MYKAALALLVGLMLSITLQSANALSLSCKRTSGMHDGFSTISAFESWFPKRVNPTAEDQISSSRDTQVSFQINGARYILTPSKVMTGSLPERAGYKSVTGVRYKCNFSSRQVKIMLASNDAAKPTLPSTGNPLTSWIDEKVCEFSVSRGDWETNRAFHKYVLEAKRRGLSCGVDGSDANQVVTSFPYLNFSNENVCYEATYLSSNGPVWHSSVNKKFVAEAKRRNLSCGVGVTALTQVASTNASGLPDCPSNQNTYRHNCFGTFIFASGNKYVGEFRDGDFNGQGSFIFTSGNKYVGEFKDDQFNGQGTYAWSSGAKYFGEFKDDQFNGHGTYTWSNGDKYVGEFKDDDFNGQGTLKYADGTIDKEGIWKDGEFQYAKKLTPSGSNNQAASSANTETNTATTAELKAAQSEADKLRQELATIKAQQQQQQRIISSDTQVPLITITSASSNGPQGTINGRVTDNTGVGEVRVDGQLVALDSNGIFKANTYVPEGGISVKVEAFDLAGLSSFMSVQLNRVVSQTAVITFDRLNPLGKQVKSNKDALALIVGVANYENTPAKAIFANSDALTFRDYASEKLGIPENRIKTLVDDGADERELLLAVKSWITRSVKQDQSDVYVFFAGHGLASDDGSQMYLLPYDGAPELLEETTISREKLFAEVAAAKPRSVTVFLDTCYSGQTRNEEMLIASRPLVLVPKQQFVPDNFTVMTAAAGDQTAKPLKEAKHGMFSYFLMKGMEGEADANQDNRITAGELHSYVQTNVIQQSSGSQTPELQGDADRVLVQFQ
jgi:hypothetical protein